MKRTKFLVVVALALVICLPGMAMATYTLAAMGISSWSPPALGDKNLSPYTGTVPSPFNFTSFVTEFSDSATFAGTGTTGIGTWTATLLGPNTSIAYGALATKPASWNYLFTGTTATYTTVFDVNYFNGLTFVGHEHFEITASGTWDKTGAVSGFDMTQHAMVPLPPSVLLLGTGILGLVGLRWRRARKEA